ncbi:MAG: ribosome assembly factor SBDS, partial [Candidatus Woesearchaeota archaeon]|nr:ribosome assembly factor SBDS [Candidatus Woesearchaeota archaeon]
EKIVDFKNKKVDVKEILLYDKIFSDVKKGYSASEEVMKSAFGTTDSLEIAKVILNEGEIQLTQEYREQKRKEKHNRILDIITRNAIDPRSGLPHPRNRIESAMEEAKFKVDELKNAEDQVNDVVAKLRPILPIKFATKEIEIKIGHQYAGKVHATVGRYGKVLSENWLTDGSWFGVVEIPAGLQNDFFDALNKLTHGGVESKIVK